MALLTGDMTDREVGLKFAPRQFECAIIRAGLDARNPRRHALEAAYEVMIYDLSPISLTVVWMIGSVPHQPLVCPCGGSYSEIIAEPVRPIPVYPPLRKFLISPSSPASLASSSATLSLKAEASAAPRCL